MGQCYHIDNWNHSFKASITSSMTEFLCMGLSLSLSSSILSVKWHLHPFFWFYSFCLIPNDEYFYFSVYQHLIFTKSKVIQHIAHLSLILPSTITTILSNYSGDIFDQFNKYWKPPPAVQSTQLIKNVPNFD